MTRATLVSTVVSELPLVDQAQKDRIVASPRTEDAHLSLMEATPAMSLVQSGGTASVATSGADLTVVAWNIERCLFPEDSADHLRAETPDVVLLTEVDCGMARTNQRHTAADLAAMLGMEYTFGIEFCELGLGSPVEMPFCTDHHNTHGWHGNAVLTRAPAVKRAMIRLDDHGHWFCAGLADPNQPRIGGRMAIAAIVPTDAGPVCLVSVHLESNAGVDHRDGQMQRLLDVLDTFADGAPVIIGGDLNTGNHLPDADWRNERLFDTARAQGYNWDANPDGMTTGPSLLTRTPERQMKLDWFCTRGITATDARIMGKETADGRPLSDHMPIVATFHPND